MLDHDSFGAKTVDDCRRLSPCEAFYTIEPTLGFQLGADLVAHSNKLSQSSLHLSSLSFFRFELLMQVVELAPLDS